MTDETIQLNTKTEQGVKSEGNSGYDSVAVSVIMVNYNTRELTLDAILSVYESIREPKFRFEIIVVDNASVDGSADAIEKAFPEVKVIRSEKNLGFGLGNNAGAEVARGTALFLLNTDTIVREGAIETLYHRLYADDDADDAPVIIGPFLENPDGSYQDSMLHFPTLWSIFCVFFWLDRIPYRFFSGMFLSGVDHTKEQHVDAVHGAALMIRHDLFRKLKGFDPDYFMYFEECDLAKRANSAGYTARYTPDAHVMHLIKQSSKDRPHWFYRATRESRMIYASKHMSAADRFVIRLIVHTGYAVRIVLFSLIGIAVPRLRRMGWNMLMSYVRDREPAK